MEIKIKCRSYKISAIDTPPLVSAELIRKGYEGTYYMATGVRGAVFLALRVIRTGAFVRS
jgi:hypothetical protein